MNVRIRHGRRVAGRRRGFTFTEMLVVVALVMLMGALILPALFRSRQLAQQTACLDNVHELGVAWQMLRKDADGEWTRAKCEGGTYKPQVMSDLAALGYAGSLDVYTCPSLRSPYPRAVKVESWDPSRADVQTQVYIGDMKGQCYFADEGRIPREPLGERAVMADGIEMVTQYGKEPANHPDGSNVLFADLAAQWVGKYMPEHSWVMDKHKVWGPDEDLIGGPGYYGVIQAPRDEYFPHCQAGTWRRSGYIQNPRLLAADPNDDNPWGGTGVGEDDILNDGGNDVDDIYYDDCEAAVWGEAWGDACRYGFVSYSLDTRCSDRKRDRSARDCSLAGGSVYNWRANFNASWMDSNVPAEYGGMTWGHPDELR